MAQGWSRGWFLGSSVLGLDTRRWGASFGDVTTWNTWCIWDRDDFTYLPPILAYYICFVPSAFVWYAALGSHQLACTGGRNLGWSFWISRGYLSSDSSGDSRPRVQGFRSHFLTVCTKVIRTVVFFDVHGSKFHWGLLFWSTVYQYIIPGSCSASSWSKANLLQGKRSNKRAVFWCCFATTGARSNNLNTEIWDEDTGATSSIAPSSLSQLSSKWQQFLPKEARFTWLLWRRTCVAGIWVLILL